MPHSAFDLPARLAAKADPDLVAADEQHFAAIAACLHDTLADLADRLDGARRSPARSGQHALERDQEIHRLEARLRTLRRYGVDLCLGRMVPEGAAPPEYVGRLGLTDAAGRRLLLDWRSPAAAPFFAATHADPMGLVSRRRYRWTAGRVTDYWDEVFTVGDLGGHAALDDQSAFIASLGAARTSRMRDVLATLQADQDAIVRASSRGPLVVDGGPGTGKTVVALHRCAYLLHADPRLRAHRGGVLVLGPHQPYLDYVADVLPSLGEEDVRLCTLRDLVPESATATDEADPEVARLKASLELVDAVENAVRLYEQPPDTDLLVDTEWAEVRLTADGWADAFAAPDPGTPHNEGRRTVHARLVELLVDEHDEDVPTVALRRSLQRNPVLTAALHRAWPLLEPTDVVADLWSVPAYLRACAPSLTRDEVRALHRAEPYAWTEADLPLLDAARHRLGDPAVERRRRRQEATRSAEGDAMARVVDDLVAADDSELLVMSMLRGDDLRGALEFEGQRRADPLAGPFAHVVVDEAQELTDAEWRMVLRRCPSRSLTVVGDRAQARRGFPETWEERLGRVGLDAAGHARLTINYRTPAEVMAVAAPLIRAALPDANVPTSVRAAGVPVRYGSIVELADVLAQWEVDDTGGTACVIGTADVRPTATVRVLTPSLAKGLEFDLVVLVDPAAFGDGVAGAIDRYVAMTRTTGRLVILTP